MDKIFSKIMQITIKAWIILKKNQYFVDGKLMLVTLQYFLEELQYSAINSYVQNSAEIV